MYRAVRALVVVGFILTLATCRDGMEPQVRLAPIAVAPVLPSASVLADFGLTIDGVRFVVVRLPSDTVADTTVALLPGIPEITVDIRVPVFSSRDSVSVSVIALSGTLPLFAGTRVVPIPTPLPVPEIPVDTYVGPVVDSIVIQPRSPFVRLSDSLRLQLLAFNGGVPVSQFYVSWTTSDTALVRISPLGMLHAPGTRSSVFVRARTPSGAVDSVAATFTPPATQLLAFAGGGQIDTVGQLLTTPLEVQARAADGLGVGGVAVHFRALTGAGSVTDSVVVTDSAGRARTTVTLGGLPGGQTFEAAVAGLSGSPVTFGVVALPGPPVQLLAIAGLGQLATVATALPTRPAVQLKDAGGNPVAGASVTFAVSGGGGSLTGGTQLTNAAGMATVGSWTLGTIAGPNTVTASAPGVTPVAFTATGLAGAATTAVKLVGDLQSAIVNTMLPTAPAVILRDQFNNPVPGVGVLFAPVSGGGSVTGGSAVTDTSGVATVGSWRLGMLVGQNMLTASASGLPGSPVGFTATATRDVASQLVRVSTDTQTATAGQPVGIPPAVRVADQYGNGVPGVSVTFALTGTLFGSLTPSVATTDTAGVARVGTWTLATVGGLNTLDATTTGLAGSPMTFGANGIVTTATTITLNAGDGQSGVAGSVLTVAYAVKLMNAVGLPVANVPVNWAVDATGGSMNPVTSLTDANGIASSTRRLGPGVGTQTATATHGGLLPVTFTATAVAGAAVQLVKQSLDPQTGIVASAVAAPVVKVVDQSGNGVSGVIVNFAAAGGGTLGATQVTSDTAGIASAGSWTLGSRVGTDTVTVTAGALPAVTFAATGFAGPPAQLAFVTEPTHGLMGNPIAPTVQVAIQDLYGNVALTAKDVVSLGLTPKTANLQGNVAAAVNGVASFPGLVVDAAGLGYTLNPTSGNLTGAPSTPFDVGGVIAAVPVDQGPVAAAVNPTTGRVYVPSAAAVAVVDGTKFVALPSISGLELPADAAANALTDTTFVSTAMGVVPIDGAKNVAGTPILVGSSPRGVAVDEKSNRVYVAVAADLAKGGPALVVIDGSRHAVVGSVLLDGAGQGVAFDAVSGRVFVAIPGLNELAIVDPIKLSVVGTRLVGASPHGVVADNGIVYVTNNHDNYVFVLDAFTLEEKARVPVGKLPEGIDADPARGIVYVANAGEPTLSLIETGTFTVFATLQVSPAGFTPKDAAVDRRTGLVYVPTTDNQLRVVRP